VLSPLGIASGARVFVYFHVVTDPAAEPASYTWQLSGAQKWNGGIGDFHGVDSTNPFDTAASRATNTTYGSATLVVPGVTPVTAGTMIVGGAGLDSKATTVATPSGWAEAFEATGAQVSELAYKAQTAAGAIGDAIWTFSVAAGSGGWMRALRPVA
jgi:hypothetical protein